MVKEVTKSSEIGRNELCPCGSGKKYKKCCLEKDLLKEKELLEKESHKPAPEEDSGENAATPKKGVGRPQQWRRPKSQKW